MKRLSGAILLVAAAFLCPIANAGLIGYSMVLQVTDDSKTRPCNYPSAINDVFRCDVEPGDIFIGSFAVDERLLQREGDDLVGKMYNFFLPIAGLVYDQNLPVFGVNGSAFNGFVGPFVDGGFPFIGGPAPGFNVHGGTVTGLYGGVYGISDNPFVDFGLLGPGTFRAQDYTDHIISGTMIVGRNGQNVPEPATLALLGIGFAGLGVARRRKRAARAELISII